MYSYSLDFFKKINNAYGSTSKKETMLYEAKQNMSDVYDETIDYQPDTLVDGQPMPLIVMEYHGNNLEKDRMKKIEAPPGSSFNLGSKVDCFGLKWLVTKINYNQEVKLSGQIQLCNYVLKFQDKEGNIIEEECVEKTYQVASTGQNEGKIITTNDTLKHILVQYNQDVMHLYQGKRLFIDLEGVSDPKVYEITNINRTTNMYGGYGFFDITCDETELQSGDRPDLMIADYIEPSEPPTPSIGLCEITYSGEPIIRVSGSAKRFTAVFKDNDGNHIDSITPSWTIEPEEIADKIVISSQVGNEIRLTTENSGLVGESFTLKVFAEDSEYGYFEREQIVLVEPLW